MAENKCAFPNCNCETEVMCVMAYNSAKELTRLRAEVEALRADKVELLECLQDIVREKELHGQVVDGTMAARKLLDKHQNKGVDDGN